MWSFKNQLQQMLACQAELNAQTSTQNWVLRPGEQPVASDFLHQVMAELAELMAHLDPIAKWWSKKPFSAAKTHFACKLELVDMLHFYLSIWLCRRDGRNDLGIEPMDEEAFVTDFFRAYEDQKLHEPSFDAIWFASCKRARSRFEEKKSPAAFVELLAHFNVSMEELVRLYAAKNALNRLRQANGYGTGDYNKFWFDGQEDTWALEALTPKNERLSLEEVITDLQEQLQDQYDAASSSAGDPVDGLG